MPKSFRERFVEAAGEHPYAWAVARGLPKDLVTAVMRGGDEYRPIRRTLQKLADATDKSVSWWLTGEEQSSEGAIRVPQPAPVIGTVAGGSSRVDIRKLELAIKALETWESTRQLAIAAERRPAVIAVLYDFLVKSEDEGTDGIDVVLRALA